MVTRGRVLFARTESWQTLISEGSVPVFPVPDQEFLHSLEELSAVSGFELSESVRPQARPILQGEGLVACLSTNLQEEARLYAHLTDREFGGVVDLDELPHLSGLEVLVLDAEGLTFSLLRNILGPKGERSDVGLILARPGFVPESLMLRAAAVWGIPGGGAAYVSGIDSESADPSGDFRFLGRESTGDSVSRLLSGGLGLLCVDTHSDGIDADLPGDLSMCRAREASTTYPGRLPAELPCMTREFCFRQGRPMESASLVSPIEISAQIFVFQTCYGLTTDELFWAPQLRIADGVLSNQKIGAAVLHPNLGFSFSGNTASPLFNRLCQGVPLGTAVQAQLAQDVESELWEPYAIFGDPRVISRPPPGAKRAGLDGGRPSVRSPVSPGGVLYDWLVGQAAMEGPSGDLASEAARLYPLVPLGADRLGEFQKVFLPLAARQPNLFPVWNSRCMRARVEDRRCPSCGLAAATYVARLLQQDYHVRRLRFCPRCQCVEDSPLDIALELIAPEPGGRFVLRGEIPEGRGLIRLHSQGLGNSKCWSWPGNTRTDREFFLDGVDLSTFAFADLIIATGRDYVWLSAPVAIESGKVRACYRSISAH